ncbi:BCL2/adenovirus E1B 19 kDa protein-interacting protein 3-like [Uloborus diversus]|uniref:BCL2/adenovirus E1B 19 kDa protein-interacting protein 3-like n=1 Tax=Uloborus diversus TaxID=327109 RepID=UPI0024097B14|nr:BCL2/adenovirus E1B 19 kDa protein-interacting protein 3-like [Uloborus diversus]
MSYSVKSLEEENLNDSWVDLNVSGELSRGSDGSQKRSTPISSLISSGKLEKLLWEAQRESCHSSLGGSGISSHRESPKSPRSPTEEHVLEEMMPCQFGVVRRHGSTDWIWDWSSKPDQRPPKEWKLHHPKPTLSLRNSKAAKSGLFSTEMLTIIFFSNLLSVLIGTGIGLYISKRIGSEFFQWSRH